MITLKTITTILICFISLTLFGQTEKYQFKHITIEDGLLSNRVHSFGQDKNGFIWIGTSEGLQRYDGYNLKAYHKIPHYGRSPLFEDNYGSLWMICEGGQIYKLDLATEKFKSYPSVGIRTRYLYYDNKGKIWAGTRGNGFAQYVQEADSFIIWQNDPSDNNTISSNIVWKIFQDSKSNIWIGTANGLNLFDPTNGNFKKFVYGPKGSVEAINEDKYGIVWVGATDGLYEFNPSSGEFKRYGLQKSIRLDNIFIDSKNRLWLSTDFGVISFNKSKSEYIYYPAYSRFIGTDNAWSHHPILESKDGSIWSVVNLKLSILDEQNKDFIIFHNNPINPNTVNDEIFCEIFEDKDDNLWFATMSGGVNYINSFKKQFVLYPKKLVTSLFVDSKGVLWIGTQNGLYKTIIKNGKKEYKKIEEINNIVCQITEDKSGNLWIAAYSHLIKLNLQSQKITKYSGKHRWHRVLCDSRGRILVGGSDEISRFDPDNGKFYAVFNISTKEKIAAIQYLVEDKDSNLWTGGASGLINLTKDLHKPINIRNIPDIKNIYVDSDKIMWAVATNNRIFTFNISKGLIKEFTPKAELIRGDIINIIHKSKGSLWILTTEGISKYDPVKGRINNYSTDDGFIIPSLDFPNIPYYCRNNGELYIGGNEGYIIFSPDSIKDNTNPTKVVLTDFKIKNKSVEISDTSYLNKNIKEVELIELPYYENMFSIEFAALDYKTPQKNQYAYKLEGFNEDWVYTDAANRVASFTNLDPGEYLFRVKGSYSDVIWSEAVSSVYITILPPWYRTWWAYSLYTLLVLSILVYFYFQQQKRLRLKHEIEKKDFETKKIKEVDEIKSRFFANISHEFRTPLTLILGPAEKIISNSSQNTAKDARIIKRSASRLLQLVNQLLDLSKLESGKLKLSASNGDIVSFIQTTALFFESLLESKDIILKILPKKKHIKIYFDKEKMLKILTNLLSNACKFTPENGKITISVDEKVENNESGYILLNIKNTGIGIPEESLSKLFDRFYQVDSSFTKDYEGTGIGLALTKELVELHHGNISVNSKIGENKNLSDSWTEFTVKLPLGKEHLKEDEIVDIDEKDIEYDIIMDDENYFNSMGLSDSTEILHGTKIIVLVVEDNCDMREYIKESLSDIYQVEEAVNGEQGVRKALKIIPDLIISDLMMPKMDGNELTRILKNDEKTSHIPIIILTAKAGQESKMEGLQTGADDYLTKPFDVNELRVRVENLINIREKLHKKFSDGRYKSKVEGKKLNKIDELFMDRVNEVIEKHLSEEGFNIEAFSKEICMSRTQLHRKLKGVVGKSPSQYLRSVRLNRAKDMIKEQQGYISEIAYSVGFSSPAYFTKCFRDEFDYPPSELLD